ncbi:tRNA (cytosine(34)-C(5))-methyltransferase [Geranomyces variabilis]|uniref:tRNA (Cytosine(34)-C(5))-methyltransferase n=1 Tax=Geranomyces variabilis TaxID=109894 RepID=A0AAD5XSA3_9FUNG|nr:tRNA (cytosine(34)-C(5))-methyltransferase [Geranomyces variabilis]
MGGDRKKGRFQKKRDRGSKRKANAADDGWGAAKKEVVMENHKFETYYKAQKILSDDEFVRLMESLRTLLPISFRITGSRSHALELRDLMINEYFPTMEDFEVDGVKVEVPKPLPWYPQNLGWVSTLSRQALRKSPQLARFHRFLVAETEVGNISRQEVVSMIPVELMDVKPHHVVLDMCASPGSKTAQILEALHADESDAIPEGLVIANDADQERCYMLVKQAKRLQSPCLMVTNHDGQQFPSIYYSGKDSERQHALRFDRILADVPCTGDGTFRKNLNIWNTWAQGNGNGLHRLQLPILLRGAALLKIGGRIVYSTCSFNPVENEAVVAAAIRMTQGALRVVDVSAELPALIRKPGLSTWVVQHKDGPFFKSFDEANTRFGEMRHGLTESMFPAADVAEMNLDRCLRVYPHDQNTGGFFVAVLEKVKPFGALDRTDGLAREEVETIEKAEAERLEKEMGLEQGAKRPAFRNKTAPIEEAAAETPDDSSDHKRKRSEEDESKPDAESAGDVEDGSEPLPKKAKEDNPDDANAVERVFKPRREGLVWVGGESPYRFLLKDDPELVQMRRFFDLGPGFPEENFVVRSENDSWKTIYFVSTPVKKIVSASNSFRLKIVNTGIRIFTRNSANDPSTPTYGCPFRLANDGLSTIGPFVGDRSVIHASMKDVITLLSVEYPKFQEFDEHMADAFKQRDMGSCVVKFDPAAQAGYDGRVRTAILLPIWRAQVSVSLLINKNERKSLMHRLTGNDLEIRTGMVDEPKKDDVDTSAAPSEAGAPEEAEWVIVDAEAA